MDTVSQNKGDKFELSQGEKILLSVSLRDIPSKNFSINHGRCYFTDRRLVVCDYAKGLKVFNKILSFAAGATISVAMASSGRVSSTDAGIRGGIIGDTLSNNNGLIPSKLCRVIEMNIPWSNISKIKIKRGFWGKCYYRFYDEAFLFECSFDPNVFDCFIKCIDTSIFVDDSDVKAQTKKRSTYVILALFLGWLGMHNFYAERKALGIIQLMIFILLGWLYIPIILVYIWAITEIFTVKKDGKGVPFK